MTKDVKKTPFEQELERLGLPDGKCQECGGELVGCPHCHECFCPNCEED